MKTSQLTTVACLLLAALPLGASAMDDRAHAGLYVGAGAGTNSLNGDDYTGNGRRVDDNQRAYKAVAGMRTNPVVSIEAQYIDFGTAGDGSSRVKAHGATLGGLFEAPVTPFVHPYAKAGALFWNSDASFSGVDRNEDGVDFTYGGGARFVLGSRVDLRAEYERFEFDQNRVNTISALLQLSF